MGRVAAPAAADTNQEGAALFRDSVKIAVALDFVSGTYA
jgi:hypothetical protein